MATDDYSIEKLAADIKRVVAESADEREMLSRIRPLAKRAAEAKDSWFEPRLYATDPEQGFGVHLLHEEFDHSLAILVVAWLPHRGAPPHDHGTWAVVAGVEGPEKNELFERVDDGARRGYAEVRKIGEKVFDAHDVLTLRAGAIHSVSNESDAVTVSLHIYGRNINYTGRSQFDVERKMETPYLVVMHA